MFFLVEGYQYLVNTGNSFLPKSLLVRSFAHPQTYASSLDRAASSIDRRVCARGGMAPCFPLALPFACVPARFWDALGQFHLPLANFSLFARSAFPVLPTMRNFKIFGYSTYSYTHLTSQFNGPPFCNNPCLQFIR